MKKCYIWGTGKAAQKFYSCVKNQTKVLGFIDNDKNKWGEKFEGKSVFGANAIIDYDYIFVSVRQYEPVAYQLKMMRFEDDKILYLFEEGAEFVLQEIDFIDVNKWKVFLLEEENNKLKNRLNNAVFENYKIIDNENYWFPTIASNKDAVKKITQERCSMIRFGDGEFEVLSGRNRAPFQITTQELSHRLKEAILYDDKELLIAIADIYGSLSAYTEQIADGMRSYLTPKVRQEHLRFLQKNKIYYNALLFKTYMPYRDKEKTSSRIQLIKEIWNKKNIIIVEGDKTRSGIGNDLFDNANSIKRILAPTKNAYDKYEEIITNIKKIEKDKLILMALGPAGKVMALDLFKAGYQVVDIGQLDMDYDWYKAGLGYKVPNKYKYVSQLPEYEVLDIDDEEYLSQILYKID